MWTLSIVRCNEGCTYIRPVYRTSDTYHLFELCSASTLRDIIAYLDGGKAGPWLNKNEDMVIHKPDGTIKRMILA